MNAIPFRRKGPPPVPVISPQIAALCRPAPKPFTFSCPAYGYLGDNLAGRRVSAPEPMDIINVVAKHWKVSVRAILSRTRRPLADAARHEAIFQVAYQHPELTLVQIGKLFGDRHHTTILHAIRAHYERITGRPWDYSRTYTEVIRG